MTCKSLSQDNSTSNFHILAGMYASKRYASNACLISISKPQEMPSNIVSDSGKAPKPIPAGKSPQGWGGSRGASSSRGRGGGPERGRGSSARGGGRGAGRGSGGDRVSFGDREGKPFSPGRGRGGSSDRGGGRGGGSDRGGRGGGSTRGGRGGGSERGGRGGGSDRGGGRGGARGGGRGGYQATRDDNSSGAKPSFFAKGEKKGNDAFETAKSLNLPMGGDGKWFEHIPNFEDIDDDKKRKRNKKTGSDVEQASADDLKELARLRLEREVSGYDNKGKQRQRDGPGQNNSEFLKKILSSGTLTDKMASMTLMVQEAPMVRFT